MRVPEQFWIEDGRITEIRPFYWDPAGLRRILGMS
jgi:ketosteroid isomerase-like protein